MVETLNIDFRTGSLIEKYSQSKGVNVGNSITKQEKGLAYAARQANSGQITYLAADTTALNFGTGVFSVAIAMRRGEFINVGSGWNHIFGKGTLATNMGIGLGYLDATGLRFTWGDGASDEASISLSGLSNYDDGQYHLLFLTFDGTTYKAFTDNIVDANTSITTKTITSAEDLYIIWRDACFIRDDYSCQKCGKVGGDLHVHHIVEFNKIIRSNNIKDSYEAHQCDELWNIDNGISLCADCHKLEHSSRSEVI